MTDLYNVYMFVNGLDESEEIIYNGVNYLNKNRLHTFENGNTQNHRF